MNIAISEVIYSLGFESAERPRVRPELAGALAAAVQPAAGLVVGPAVELAVEPEHCPYCREGRSPWRASPGDSSRAFASGPCGKKLYHTLCTPPSSDHCESRSVGSDALSS